MKIFAVLILALAVDVVHYQRMFVTILLDVIINQTVVSPAEPFPLLLLAMLPCVSIKEGNAIPAIVLLMQQLVLTNVSIIPLPA